MQFLKCLRSCCSLVNKKTANETFRLSESSIIICFKWNQQKISPKNCDFLTDLELVEVRGFLERALEDLLGNKLSKSSGVYPSTCVMDKL